MNFAETYQKLLKQRIETHDEALTFDEPFIKALFTSSQITFLRQSAIFITSVPNKDMDLSVK